ncbi:hypothetical protein [Solitalea canadensis]|uniref:Integral membrane protein n=1 Tax=Solitalea canadensis (strain ATCC 29591 / DSM 3403 / JCM 21819 / LMG 8368 / NBRC 15130 / NCIMB 12057 / USAM 9D) TaxID=929556 RepID=H8KWD1_SOLCM|nr:hypothetical protein [Solitalea canadensis]AFD07923.1 hypothetical protein Solca_2901 [Solitalea canadensis DSM 3403]
MNYIVLTYLIYLPIAACLTIWVGNTLFKNGKVFLVDIFQQNKELADAVNKLLLVGFYLLNIGYAVWAMKVFDNIVTTQGVIEVLSEKIGAIILVLGVVHFTNIIALYKLRKRTVSHYKNFVQQQIPVND